MEKEAEILTVDLSNVSINVETRDAKEVGSVFVITDHMACMPTDVCGVFDSKDAAIKGVEALIVAFNKDESPEDNENEAWVYTSSKTKFVRIKQSIMKNKTFAQICNDPRLYHFKYEIREFPLNKIKYS